MVKRKGTIAFFWLAALLLVGACVPISPNPPAPTTTAAAADATGNRITGQVFWASAPASEAIVDLRPRAQSEDPASTVQRVTADNSGAYVLDDVRVGEYILVAQWPDGDENPGRRTPVNVEPGAVLTEVNVYIERPLRLLAPDSGAETTTQPHLAWTPFPEAVQYRVWVIDAGTTALLFNPTLADTETTVAPPLEPGHTYTLEVQALDAAGAILASAKREFRIKP
jgi:hypothetical protein